MEKRSDHLNWSNNSDLTRPHPTWWLSKGDPLISGKSSLVEILELARSKTDGINTNGAWPPFGDDHSCKWSIHFLSRCYSCCRGEDVFGWHKKTLRKNRVIHICFLKNADDLTSPGITKKIKIRLGKKNGIHLFFSTPRTAFFNPILISKKTPQFLSMVVSASPNRW